MSAGSSPQTPQAALQELLRRAMDVAGFPIVRNWYIVHRTDKRLSPVARAFKEFLLGEAAVPSPAK